MKELGGEEECDVTYFPKPYVTLSKSATAKMVQKFVKHRIATLKFKLKFTDSIIIFYPT